MLKTAIIAVGMGSTAVVLTWLALLAPMSVDEVLPELFAAFFLAAGLGPFAWRLLRKKA